MNFFWSIYKNELKKVLPLAGMMFCIIFIYSLCRDLKDTLVVSKAICGGAETIGFVKIFMVTPAAVLFMLLFVKLSNAFSRQATFHILIGFFFGIFSYLWFCYLSAQRQPASVIKYHNIAAAKNTIFALVMARSW